MEEIFKNERIIQLIRKLHAGGDSLTDDERRELDEWVALNPADRSKEVERGNNPLLRIQELREYLQLDQHLDQTEKTRFNNTLHKIRAGRPVTVRIWLLRHWHLAAACLFFAVAALVVFFLNIKDSTPPSGVAKNGVLSDTLQRNAILTLNGGREIVLHADSQVHIKEGDAMIQQRGDELSYQPGGEAEARFNRLTTPKASQYTIVLADGSRVYLNANSSLTFPTVFHENMRRVKLEGEAFFEVARNSQAPFFVQIGESKVEVLGTKFNISAYNIDKVTTTLTEGSVRVYHRFDERVILPGEQTLIDEKGKLVVQPADLDKVLAWREGRFYFENATVDEIMTSLSRWYDIEIKIKESIDRRYTGSFKRSMPVEKVLSILEANGGVHFEYDAVKRVVVVSQSK